MNEVLETLKSYFSQESNSIQFHGDDSMVKRFANALSEGEVKEYDAPDSYIKYENELWVIEHFEFDCYKEGRKGSTYKKEQNRIDRAENDIIPSKEGTIFKDTINAKSSYEDYISNITNHFISYYQKIAQYKRNLIKDKIADINTKFVIMFLIDDVSPLGSSYVDENGSWRPIVLAHSRKFLELLEKSNALNGVLAVSCGSQEKFIWFIDRTCINEYYPYVENYENCKFMNFKPHVIGFKMKIPKEIVSSNQEGGDLNVN